ncbi:MAG: hypothetical protein GYA17_03370 [Chloroflexi bacterium]|jgi:flagellar biosynthesis/type III secretory pathway protein FliH|nr:hypothetical protein [Chloroflexota bacterium]
MKSSSNLIHSRDVSVSVGIQAWAPDELGAKPAEKPAVRAEDILSIFHLDTPGTVKSQVHTGLVKGERALSGVAQWAPQEFGRQDFSAAGRPVSVFDAPHAPQAAPPPAEPVVDPILEASEKAAEIIRIAQQQADSIVQQAQHKADEVALEAHRQGWAAAEAETTGMLQTAQSLIDQIVAWREELFAQSEPTILALVKDIGQAVYGPGMILDSEALQQNLNRAVENARSLGDLRIFIHPDDAANLGPFWREFQISLGGHQIQVVASSAIQRGGCFIDGQWGSVDARVETQLKTVMEALTEGMQPARSMA